MILATLMVSHSTSIRIAHTAKKKLCKICITYLISSEKIIKIKESVYIWMKIEVFFLTMNFNWAMLSFFIHVFSVLKAWLCSEKCSSSFCCCSHHYFIILRNLRLFICISKIVHVIPSIMAKHFFFKFYMNDIHWSLTTYSLQLTFQTCFHSDTYYCSKLNPSILYANDSFPSHYSESIILILMLFICKICCRFILLLFLLKLETEDIWLSI